MASTWNAIGKALGKIARERGPQLFEQIQKSGAVQRATGVLTGAGTATTTATPGRPVASHTAPTAHRARTVEYSPDLDGRADPGEIVWTWVAYEDDPSQGKDRPVLVVGRDGHTLLGLMLSSQERRSEDRDWVAIGAGDWDSQGRPSWVRLDRVLDVPEDGIRREGAIVERRAFDKVAARLRSDFSWR
ncbi:type II toxin-antitoxin system PemK/MazF family toxin [Rhodococcus triatomae]|uniref:PemK-like, MazF-like toxin of type II toxin-antitoxin system n=1 Tax=Rhodococcus triatomae TaxID=300028 RepID=A0A1G8DMP5_9NOCA|nr:type II toxin-antitoxin system PemK/MazF family toxin [Rhodococcus triatomae]QNG18395.1 type II toxin-antitoxin system PemK/MazF family toxin [Rhodococcus triatomae]QNG21935.1 type II toxin-antitoxin system PemK/MazF family toxin [Rhodococcus triatomae]SDH58865.1 PemK-like, MazF-like toxin of type II toxin-antitoxin system [Rhodococcus triatomae]